MESTISRKAREVVSRSLSDWDLVQSIFYVGFSGLRALWFQALLLSPNTNVSQHNLPVLFISLADFSIGGCRSCQSEVNKYNI